MTDPLDEQAIIGRIIQLRCDHSGPRGRANFAKALGLSPSTYNYYENDRLPGVAILWRICRLCDVSMEWLLTGEESSGSKYTIPDSLRRKIASVLKNRPQSLKTIEVFVDLLASGAGPVPTETQHPTEEKLTARSDLKPSSNNLIAVLGRTAAGVVHYWNTADHRPRGTELKTLIDRCIEQNAFEARRRPLDVQSQLAHCDQPGAIQLIQLSQPVAEGVSEFIASSDITGRWPDAFALRIDGASMEPALHDGDFVVLSPSVQPANGGTAVVKVRNQVGVTCKIIRHDGGRWHLIPMNDRYDITVVDTDQIEWALAVLYRIRLAGGQSG